MTYAENITMLRNSLQLTRKEVADKLGITVQAYSAYEAGVREPRRENILKLADIFGVTTDVLLLHDSITYERVKAKLAQFGTIFITELENGLTKVKITLPSDYPFEPAVIMNRNDLVDIYKRNINNPLGLENAFRSSIIYEYAQTVFLENPQLGTVNRILGLEEPKYDPNEDIDYAAFGVEPK